MKIILRCEEPWSYTGWNRVVISWPYITEDLPLHKRLDAVWNLCGKLNAVTGDKLNVAVSDDCFFTRGAESFNLSDLAQAITDTSSIAVEVQEDV